MYFQHTNSTDINTERFRLTDLRTNFEVSLLMKPDEVPLRAWARAPVSCDRVGEAGGPL